jgi:hypothetical protein
MQRAIISFVDGGFCNLEADYIDADDKYVSIHLGDKIVGIFQLEFIKGAYLSKKPTNDNK